MRELQQNYEETAAVQTRAETERVNTDSRETKSDLSNKIHLESGCVPAELVCTLHKKKQRPKFAIFALDYNL